MTTPPPFSAQDVRHRALSRLSRDTPAPPDVAALSAGVTRPRRLAAVLVPIIARPSEATVLLTLRTATLRSHSGQIAFPGGAIDPDDPSPASAAMREAMEEVGLHARHIEFVGYLDAYPTRTGFYVVPAVAIVTPPFDLVPNPIEVADIFEVPVPFLMDPQNHQRHTREMNGVMRDILAMPYQERYIWGVTADLLRHLYLRLYAP